MAKAKLAVVQDTTDKKQNRAEKRASSKKVAPKPAKKNYVKKLGKIFDVKFGLFGEGNEQLGAQIIFSFDGHGVFVGYYSAGNSNPEADKVNSEFVVKIKEIMLSSGIVELRQLINQPVEAKVADDYTSMLPDWRILSEVL